MSFSLVPDRLFERYDQITPELLRSLGVTLLLSDLDFTLASKKTRRADRALKDWIGALHDSGVTLMIVSNNRSGKRVTDFCAELGVPYQGHGPRLGSDV